MIFNVSCENCDSEFQIHPLNPHQELPKFCPFCNQTVEPDTIDD